MPADDDELTAPSNGVANVFAMACKWKGQDPFFLDPYARWSGNEALQQATAAAVVLRSLGIGKGSVIAFFCASSARHAVVFFAGQMLGAVCCALHTKDTDLRLMKTLSRVGADCLISDHEQVDRARRIAEGVDSQPRVIRLDRSNPERDDLAQATAAGRAINLAPVAPEHDSVILCSSGTTGDPKCVVHTQASVLATAFAGPFVYGVSDPSDGVVVPMSPSFAAWLHNVLPFVALRGKIYFQDRFDPFDFLKILSDERLTLAGHVPSAWNIILGQEFSDDLSNLRVAFFSGERGSEKLIRELAAFAPAVRTAYLASEGGCAAAVVASRDLLVEGNQPTVVGQPIPGADLKIVESGGGFDDVIEAGQTGEIVITGRSLAKGYLGDEKLTHENFQNGWWRTGDLGVVDSQGHLTIRGRKDNRINSGGIKIHAEEVESSILMHPAVRQAAVVGVEDPEFGERIDAHVVVDDKSISPTEILEHMKNAEILPSAVLPKAIHFHDELPTGPTGKIYRKGLFDLAD